MFGAQRPDRPAGCRDCCHACQWAVLDEDSARDIGQPDLSDVNARTELGFRVRGGGMPKRIAAYLQVLISSDALVPVP